MKKYVVLLCLIFSHNLLLAQESAHSHALEIVPSVRTTDSMEGKYASVLVSMIAYYFQKMQPMTKECCSCFYEHLGNPTSENLHVAILKGTFSFYYYNWFLKQISVVRAASEACSTCWEYTPPNEPSSI